MAVFGNIGGFEMIDLGLPEALADLGDLVSGTAPPPAAASDPSTPAAGATSTVSQPLSDALQGSHIESAQSTITLSPAGWIKLSDVAEVRAGNAAGEFIVDFQAMRTVTGIAYNKPSGDSTAPTIQSIQVWTGTEFGDAETNAATTATHQMRFSERLTERVSIIFASSNGLTAEMVRLNGTANLPSPPGDLELKIDGLTVWARPGAAKLDETGVFTETVDITADLAKALAGGAWPIAISLNASVPGLMQLANQITFQRKHKAELPGGSILVGAGQVGPQVIEIPLPTGTAAWQVHAVEMTVGGDIPAGRVLPADTPAVSAEAQLLLDEDHVVILRVPPALRKQFRTLDGVQLSLDASEAEAEIAGVFYLGDEVNPAGETASVTVMPATLGISDGYQWPELSLSEALAVDNDQELWLEVDVSRGRVRMPLAADTLPSEEAVIVRRGVPGGPYEDFRADINGSAFTVNTFMRVKGTPFKENGIPAVVPAIVGLSQEFTAFTPSSKGTPVRLEPDIPATAATGSLSDDALLIELKLRTPGSYRVSDVTIFYTIGSG